MGNVTEKEIQASERRAKEQSLKNSELFYVILRRYDGAAKEVEDRKLEEVEKCLIKGADINAGDKNNLNNTVLHTAIENNWRKIIEFLVLYGARSDVENSQGKNALALAQTLKCNQEVINMLEWHSRESNIEYHTVNFNKREKLVSWDRLKKYRSKILIVEINSREANPAFLQEKAFFEAISTMGNLFFVDIKLKDYQEIDEDLIISQLTSISNHLIIQCGSNLSTKVYCKDSHGNVNVIDLHSPVEKYSEDILTEKLSSEFGISLIVDALKLGLVGEFQTERRSLLKVSFNLKNEFNRWKLIDYAFRYGDVLTVRLLALNTRNLSRRHMTFGFKHDDDFVVSGNERDSSSVMMMYPHATYVQEEQQFLNLELFVAINYGLKRKSITEEEIIERVKKSLCNGADINAPNISNAGNTALHIAVRRQFGQVIQFLLEHGASVDTENSQGLTALTLAQTLKCEQEVINLLSRYAKPLITNKLNMTYWSRDQPIWNKFRNNSEIAVLEINSVELSPDFLQQVEFYDAIDTAGNLFFVDVMLSDTANIDEDFIKRQLKRLNKQLILQCGSTLRTMVFYKDSKGNVNIVDLNSPVESDEEDSVTESLSSEDNFGVGLIVEALKLKIVGTFESERRSLLRVSFDLEKQFHSLRLIDCAIRYGDVLTVRLLSLSNWDLTKRNDIRSTILGVAAEYGNMEKLAAVLRFKFPIPIDSISFPPQYCDQMDNLLRTAIKVGNCDVVSFLIRCGVKLDEDVIELPWGMKRYDVVLMLLRADCVFPCDFDLDKIDENDVSMDELRSFVVQRDQLHSLIEKGDLERVKEFAKSIASSKLYLNKDNKSAVYRALVSRKLNIFVWLKSELKAEFSDENERKGVGVLDIGSDAFVPHSVPIDNAHILHLVAKSRSRRHYPGFKEHIENIYKELDTIPQISTVFKVVQFCDQVDIIYDFGKGSIVDVDIASSESDKGLCDYKAGRIYIGAKADKWELLGTVAHHLTHLAIQTTYDNDCKPYNFSDSMKDEFEVIVKEIREKPEPVDDLISRVFCCNKEVNWPSELIVRVNHMLATYGSVDGVRLLETQANSLLEFYTNHVEPRFELLAAESRLIKPTNAIKFLNEYSGVISRLEEMRIHFRERTFVKEFLSSKDKQILVLSSTSTWLSLINVYQNLKESSSSEDSFLIFQFDHYMGRRMEINQAVYSEAGKLLVLECPNELREQQFIEVLSGLGNLVRRKLDKKIILIIETSELEVLQGHLKSELFNLNFEIMYEDDFAVRGDEQGSRTVTMMCPQDTDDEQQGLNLELFVAINYRLKRKNIPESKIIDKVNECLCDGADINAVNHNNAGNTVLHIAIQRYYNEVIRFLLDNGAMVDIENSQGFTALTLAQRLSSDQKIVDLLLSYAKSVTSKLSINYLAKNRTSWFKLRNNSEILILEVNSVELSPDFLQQVEFYDAIDTAGNLFFVDVMLSHMDNIDDDFIIRQLNRLNRQLIIQCGSLSNMKVYYKNSNGIVDGVNLDINCENYDEASLTKRFLDKNGFGIDLIVEALKLKLVGTFETKRRSLIKASFDLEKHFEGWKLIDHAIRYGDVLTVRLLSLSNWNLSKLNPKRTCTLSIAAQYGNVEKLAAVLRVKFPIELDSNNICVPEKTSAHFEKCKEQMLHAAVRAGNLDVISFMRRCGVHSDEQIISLAWVSEQYDVVLTLLKADCVFLSGFDLDEIDENDVSFIELRHFVEERDHLHSLIEEGDLDRVKVFVNSIAPSRLYLNKNNESALFRALKSQKLNTFVWLKSELKAEFRDENERKGVGVLDSATDALVPHFVPIDNAHILHLVAKSRCRRHYEGFKKHIESIYTELNSIEQISTVFKVIQFCDHVDIIYDFDRDRIVDVNIASSEDVTEFCEYKTGRIYIGAKVDKRELLGTIAHKLTHLAMQTVYNNDCEPYKVEDPLKETFDEIIKEIRKQSTPVDAVIRRAFSCHRKVAWPSELIVRVNQMLATYGSEDGLSRLKEQANSLLRFYTDHVEPRFKSLVAESDLIKPRNTIKFLNEYSGVIGRLEEIQIHFNESKVVKDFFDSRDKSVLVLSSTSTWLSLVNVYQTLKEMRLSIGSLLVFQFGHYTNRRVEINQALCSEAGKVLVLECPCVVPENELGAALGYLVNVIQEKPGKKVIFIVESIGLGTFQKCLQSKLSKNCFEIVSEEFSLNSLTPDSKHSLLMQNISLQNRLVPLGDLVDADSYQLVDAEILTRLVNKEKVSVGKQPIGPKGYDEEHYISRSFSRESTPMYHETDFVNHVDELKVVLVSDTAGSGRTTVLTRVNKLLNAVHPEMWVIRVDIFLFEKAQNDLNYAITNDEEALNFFVNVFLDSQMESKLETNFEKNLLLHLLNNRNEMVIIMFDGFDEIKQGHRKVVIRMLNALKETKVKQLWVTTRPNLNNNLEGVLDCVPYTLNPFSEEVQITMLSKYWKHKLGVVDEERLRHYAQALVKLFRPTSDMSKSFIGFPLQTRMIAEIFEDNCLKFCHFKMTDLDLPEQFDMIDLYQMFLEYKHKIYVLEYLSMPQVESQLQKMYQTFLRNHQISAMFTLLDEADRNLLLTKVDTEAGQSFIKDIEEGRENTGVIDRIVEGRPHFVHLTFAEYLISEFIVDISIRTRQNEDVEKYILISVFGQPLFEVVRGFIDCHLSKNSLPNEALTTYGKQLSDLWSKSERPLRVANGQTTLHVAAKEGNVNIAKFILSSVESLGESGKDTLDGLVRAKDDHSMQALHLAAKGGHRDLLKLLLDYGADINASFSTSALHIAANRNFIEMAEYLIACGANVNVKDNNGLTPLHEAAERCHPRLVELLLKHGADPEAESGTSNQTSVDLALGRKDHNAV